MPHKDNKPLSETELVNIIDQAEGSAITNFDSEIASKTAKSMQFYLGDKYGNELADHSQVVTREVMEAVEFAMPYLVKTFFGTDKAVRFQPQNEDDVDAAEQATDYVNYVFHRQNPGFKIGYTWLKDALISKIGVIKYWWDESEKSERSTFKDLDEEEIELLLADPHLEVVEDIIETNEEGIPTGRSTTIEDTQPDGQVRIENIPPEEFLISSTAVTVDKADFVAHKTKATISSLREMGFDVDDILSELTTRDDLGIETAPQYVVRHDPDNTGNAGRDTLLNIEMRKVIVLESYIRVDYDGDGVAELRKVTKVGQHILDNEEVSSVPFAVWTPVMLSHKLHGLSYADLVMDLQLIKSTLFRNILDNMYVMNNGRYVALEGQVNMDDLLSTRPNGIVRAKSLNAVKRLDTPELSANAFNLMDYVDSIGFTRTGNSERSRGTDGNGLDSNTSTSNMNTMMTAADQRIELVARVFAETGFKSAMLGIYDLVIENEKRPQMVRLNDAFIKVDPKEWGERTDMTAEVGLGNNNRDQDMFHLNNIATIQQTIVSGGGLGTIVLPKNVYNLAKEFVKTSGRADTGKFFTDPGDATGLEDEGPSIDEQVKIATIKLKEREVAIKEAEAQVEAGRLKLGQDQLALDVQIQKDDNQFRVAELELESRQERGVKLGDD